MSHGGGCIPGQLSPSHHGGGPINGIAGGIRIRRCGPISEGLPRSPDLQRSGSYIVPFASATEMGPLTSSVPLSRARGRSRQGPDPSPNDRVHHTSLPVFPWPSAGQVFRPPAGRTGQVFEGGLRVHVRSDRRVRTQDDALHAPDLQPKPAAVEPGDVTATKRRRCQMAVPPASRARASPACTGGPGERLPGARVRPRRHSPAPRATRWSHSRRPPWLRAG